MINLEKHISIFLAVVFALGVSASVIHFDDLHSHAESEIGIEYVEDHTNCVICATVFKYNTAQAPAKNLVTGIEKVYSTGELSNAKSVFEENVDSRAPPFSG